MDGRERERSTRWRQGDLKDQDDKAAAFSLTVCFSPDAA